jgi:ribosomal protein L24
MGYDCFGINQSKTEVMRKKAIDDSNVIDTGCPMHISKISKLASSQDDLHAEFLQHDSSNAARVKEDQGRT